MDPIFFEDDWFLLKLDIWKFGWRSSPCFRKQDLLFGNVFG